MSIEGQHSNEAANYTSKRTNTLLNGQNYLSWARSAKLSLSGREVLDFIIGEETKPEPAKKDEETESEKRQQDSGKTKMTQSQGVL